MNPYALARRAFTVVADILSVTMVLSIVFMTGLAGASLTGQWWGWVAGPVTVAAALLLLVIISVACMRLPEWWREQERAYRERQQTAHG